ncbi:MAG: hypothetical protein Q4G00_16580 [Clostridia bacterium]|jgi:hypothetical protein|nr:hypothetical protein [Clostridia bacterium]
MSTLESTISMLRVMPEADVRVIFEMTKKLFDDKASPFAPVSKKQILQDVDVSSRQIEQGNTQDTAEAIRELKTKYGL